MSIRCVAICLIALLRLCPILARERYGTGSGSDRVNGARSLPLPVLYRAATKAIKRIARAICN